MKSKLLKNIHSFEAFNIDFKETEFNLIVGHNFKV
jgi:DNA repair exonuclease SbcCD ATPase subunit